MFRVFLLSILVVAAGLGGSQALAQTNDNFADRLTLTGSAPIAVSNNSTATREAGEPNHAGASRGRSLWYTWTAPTSGTINLSTYSTGRGAPVVRALAVYTGTSLATLSEVASSNNQVQALYVAGSFSSPLLAGGTSLNVPVTAGTVYQIAVDAVIPPTAVDDDGTVFLAINAAPTIVSSVTATGTIGTNFSYAITATSGASSFSATGLPPGLSLNPATGQITGTPVATGTSVVDLSATGPGGTGVAVLTLAVNDPAPPLNAAPTITSAVSARAFVGATFSYTITASGSPTAFVATNLPTGLSFNATTGVISGTPSASGTFSVSLSAMNATGTGNAVLTIVVSANPPPPIITSALAANGTVGTSFTYFITTNVDGVAGAIPNAWTATGLPPGLTKSSSNYLVGTPTQAGTYAVPISATNAAGTRTATVTITIFPSGTTTSTVAPAPPVLSSAATAQGIVGTSFSYTLAASNAPTIFTASSLPGGLALNVNTGVISGTPTTAGTFAVPVTAKNGYGTSIGTLTVSIYTNSAAQTATNGLALPIITSPASASGYVGRTLNYTVTATSQGVAFLGGNWTFGAAGLPPGLALTSSTSSTGTGTISGSPTAAGTYTATISATCPAYTSSSISHPAATATATVVFVVQAAAKAPAAPPVITSSAAVSATAGSAISYAVTASGNPVSYAATGLPPGMVIDTASGVISGVPMSAGLFATAVSASNISGSASAIVTFDVVPAPLPVFTSAANATGTLGSSFSYQIAANNAPAAYGASNLPPGLNFNAGTGRITGTPTVAGTYTIPISVSNINGTVSTTLTITINAGGTIPLLLSDAVAQATLGQTFYYVIQTQPIDASCSVGALPAGFQYVAAAKYIYATPTVAGTFTVPITTTNSSGTSTATLTIVVPNVAVPGATAPPVLSLLLEKVFYAGLTIPTYTLSALNGATSYSASGLPPGLSLDSSTGALTGTPTTTGTYSVHLSATNAGGTGTAVWTLIIKPLSVLQLIFTPPVVAEVDLTVGQSQEFNFVATAYDGASSVAVPMTATFTGIPPGMSSRFASGVASLVGVPTAKGVYNVTSTIAITSGTSTTVNILLVVSNPPKPLIVSAAEATGNVLFPFSYSIMASGTATSFSCGNLPDGLSLNVNTGAVTGTPTTAGIYAIAVSTTGSYGTGSATLTIRIDPPLYSGLPIITAAAAVGSQDFPPDTTLVTNFLSPAINYTITTLNPRAAFTAANVPIGMVFNPSTGILSGTPTIPGIFQVPISATNSVGTVNATLTVIANSPRSTVRPALAYGGYVGGSFSAATPLYLPAFLSSYATGSGYSTTLDPVVYRAAGLPAGLSISSYTGQITGTPTQAGTFPVTLTAANRGGSGSAITTISITASAPAAAAAPQWSGKVEAAGFLNIPISYALTAANATNYAATGLPTGLSLDPSTGIISGTPMMTGTSKVSISASNSAGTAQAVLTVTVETAPFPPIISSASTATATVGSNFTYSLTTSNLTNLPTATRYATTSSALPSGLSLNPITGIISGTPTGPAGTYPVPITALVGPTVTTVGTLTLFVQTAPAMPMVTSAAGALGLTGNPFYYAIRNAAFSPDLGMLPAGLVYDAVNGVISGYPQSVGTYSIPLSSSGTSSIGSFRRNSRVAPKPIGGRPKMLPADSGSTATASLTLKVLAPDVSLPRLVTQPIDGAAMEGTDFAFTAVAVGAPSPVYQWQHNGVPLTGATGASLILNAVSPADTGDYSVTASNVAGSVTSSVVSLLVQTTYGQWQTDHFTAQEINDGLASDDASFSGDGVPNLLKYALGLDPRAALNGSLPTSGSRSAADGTLQIELNRDAALTDIDYVVEASADLHSWTIIAQSIAGDPVIGLTGSRNVTETAMAGTSQRHVTAGAAAPGGSSQFLRLQVIRP